MRRFTWMLTIVIALSFVLAACGKKDADGVVKDLDKVVAQLESYQGSGTMTLYTGDKPQEYKVEVWYQNPSFYRIALTNAQKDVTQIVLRNEQGVFVLTPSLNKSFRFQSDWPENQGQVYLYQTLARSILSDSSRQFESDKESYIFEVAANYNTHALVRQKIWLAKDNYAPKQVQVSDAEAKVVVEVKFDKFDFDAKFDKNSFDMQHNLDTAAQDSQGTLLEVDENGMLVEKTPADEAAGANGDAASNDAEGGTTATPATPALTEPFGVIIPTYLPDGVLYQDDQAVEGADRTTVLLRYDGTYPFTLSETRSPDRTASLVPGELVDMGFTWGLLTGDALQTLTWTVDGLEFRITSENLPVTEMVKIAASMQDQTGK
ncbi:outer membrane lipoprotein carrier protein LolA [Paenibacillus timonensis]|uniref:Outer membrane lipoprotein carrier protein LolA n=1 Tax=Paenibacillus timonensis TaxID=225915 RepID=A0ABW3S769_9BACL|nr:outer membrane lipoprotein carrier protein LolA [Paenibacillus timonensis]MCH1638650.1 outer membrane lipoprotein carrier protein LolA [Paenibacillus timonensis]